MLSMTCELWPFGDTSSPKRLVTIALANIGRVHWASDECNYVFTIDEPDPLFGEPIHFDGILLSYNRRAPCTEIMMQCMSVWYEGNPRPLNDEERETATRLRQKLQQNLK